MAQARGVLGSTPGDCQPFHFPLFSSHTIFISSVRQDAVSKVHTLQSPFPTVSPMCLASSRALPVSVGGCAPAPLSTVDNSTTVSAVDFRTAAASFFSLWLL